MIFFVSLLFITITLFVTLSVFLFLLRRFGGSVFTQVKGRLCFLLLLLYIFYFSLLSFLLERFGG